jgi:hypothetical protein
VSTPTHVDLLRAMCQTLGLRSHSALAPDLTPGEDWGAGWVTREEAIALGRRLLADAGDPQWLTARAEERRAGRLEGFEQGWRMALRVLRGSEAVDSAGGGHGDAALCG